MFLKALIFLITVSAHIWLLGQWSLEKSSGFTIILLVSTALAVFLFVYPIHFLFRKKNTSGLFEKRIFVWTGLIYVLLVSVLCIMSFYGLVQYILPVNVMLFGIKLYFQWKSKRQKQLD